MSNSESTGVSIPSDVGESRDSGWPSWLIALRIPIPVAAHAGTFSLGYFLAHAIQLPGEQSTHRYVFDLPSKANSIGGMVVEITTQKEIFLNGVGGFLAPKHLNAFFVLLHRAHI